VANPTESAAWRIRGTHERRPPITVFAPHGCERRTNGASRLALSERILAKKASPRSTVEMVGPPFVTRCELQQFPACTGEATLAGQIAEPVGHFSIVCPVNRQGAVPSLVHR
jgi:hypothetical protein